MNTVARLQSRSTPTTYNYDYRRGMTTVQFSSTGSPEGSTYATAMDDAYARKLLKDGYYIVMLNGYHSHCCVKSFWDEDGVECTSEILHMRYIPPAQGVKRSQVANNFTPFMWRKAPFIGMIKSLPSFAEPAKKNMAYTFQCAPNVHRQRRDVLNFLDSQL